MPLEFVPMTKLCLRSASLCAVFALLSSASVFAQLQCGIFPEKELFITDVSVVDDPIRTGCVNPLPAHGDPQGAWTFARLMTNMAGNHNPSDFVLRWLLTWTVPQNVNGFVVFDPIKAASIQNDIITPWLNLSGGGQLDLCLAPFRLTAIVYRPDLAVITPSGPGGYISGAVTGGEGRFVFTRTFFDGNGGGYGGSGGGSTGGGSVISAAPTPIIGGRPVPGGGTGEGDGGFNIIFEYNLPANTCEELVAWAHRWHNLGSIPFGATFNEELQKITDDFVGPNAEPKNPNGSALNQLRSNEISMGGPWELREWNIVLTDPSDNMSGLLTNVTTKQSPDGSFNGSNVLFQYLQADAAAILAGTHVVPDTFLGNPFLGGQAVNFPTVWDSTPSALTLPSGADIRFNFAVNTCEGCHFVETATPFVHVSTRNIGFPANISGFLTGIFGVPDPVAAGVTHDFFDLDKRAKVLCDLLILDCSRQIGTTSSLNALPTSLAQANGG